MRLTWPSPGATKDVEVAGSGPDANPALHLLRLLEAVQQHDSHRRAAQQS